MILKFVCFLVDVFRFALEKHITPFLSSLSLGWASAALVTCILSFSGDAWAPIPFTRPLPGTLGLPGPTGRREAHVPGSRLLPFWMGAGCLGEGL